MVAMEESNSTTDLEQKNNKMQRLKATMMMIFVQFILAGITIFYKLATNDGMHILILIAYRYLFASIIILPIALYVERNNRTKLTWKILVQAFVCTLVGPLMVQLLYAESLVLTTATYAAAINNLVPPFTFIIGIFLRTEKVKIGTIGGKATVIGTLMGVAGAMVLTFCKGHRLWSTHFNVLHGDGHVVSTHKTSSTHHIIGSLCALAASFCVALYMTLQGKLSAVYPSHYSCTCLLSVMGCIQSLVFALCVERSWSQWKLGWNIRLLAIFFMGIGSTLSVLFLTKAIHLQGALFASNFNPLSLVFVTIVGSLLLDESLHVGSVLGVVIIIIGLYIMLWGKSNMMKLSKQMPTTSTKDVNEVSSINAATTTLDTIKVALPSLPTTHEDKELPLSITANQKDQKVAIEQIIENDKVLCFVKMVKRC